jgi:RsiW-degrading membrane proteinase PrsW (M82 family)
MTYLKSKFFEKSRSRSFLWKLCIGTLVLGIVVGFVASRFDFKSDLSLQSRIETYFSSNLTEFSQADDLQSQLTDVVYLLVEESFEAGELELEELLTEIPFLSFWIQGEGDARFEDLFKKYLSAYELGLVDLFIEALGENPDKALIRLKELGDTNPIPRYVNQILALIESNKELHDNAYYYLVKEGTFPEALWAREQAVINRHYRKDFKSLEDLESDPIYNDAFSPWIRMDLASHNHDWLSSIKWIAIGQLAGLQPGSFILATIAMLVWGTILLQLGQANRFDRWTPVLCFLGLILGMLSITPTQFWIVLEDLYLPISEGEDLFHSIVYFIATVGLREEVCKLLLFLPLTPILIRRRNELEFLLVASFVGLGFAYVENFNYLISSMGTGVAGRFLTANFFHISLTGMSGLFFCRMWKTRGFGYNDFLFIFGVAIIAHGLYDALLTHPPMDDGGFIALVLFVVFSKYYFQEVHHLQEVSKSIISLSASMSFGISLLLASLVVYLSIVLSVSLAIQLGFGSFLGSGIILIMFFREFNESLGD